VDTNADKAGRLLRGRIGRRGILKAGAAGAAALALSGGRNTLWVPRTAEAQTAKLIVSWSNQAGTGTNVVDGGSYAASQVARTNCHVVEPPISGTLPNWYIRTWVAFPASLNDVWNYWYIPYRDNPAAIGIGIDEYNAYVDAGSAAQIRSWMAQVEQWCTSVGRALPRWMPTVRTTNTQATTVRGFVANLAVNPRVEFFVQCYIDCGPGIEQDKAVGRWWVDSVMVPEGLHHRAIYALQHTHNYNTNAEGVTDCSKPRVNCYGTGAGVSNSQITQAWAEFVNHVRGGAPGTTPTRPNYRGIGFWTWGTSSPTSRADVAALINSYPELATA
jgi:hypothetical protein